MADEKPFLPAGYEIPATGGGFTKLKPGKNLMRILSAPLLFWQVWEDGKVTRLPYTGPDSKPAKPTKTVKDSVKHGWGVIIYNYDTQAIEIFEITWSTVQSDLEALAKNPKWGHPKLYDVEIDKTGSGMDTEYKTIPSPPTDPSPTLVKAFVECPINLDLLLVKDGNPFLANGGSKANTAPQQQAAKIVTPENWVAGDPIPSGYKVDAGRLVKNALPF